MASAVILHESDDGETGFLAFSFDQYPEHADAQRVIGTWNEAGQPHLIASAGKDRYLWYVEDIEKSVSRFLREQGVSRDEIRFLIPPQISPAFVRAVSQELDLPNAETIDVSSEDGDLATSSTPAAMQAIVENNIAEKGDVGLIINIASGGQVGCALYQF